MLYIFYRACADESAKWRPPFYSKYLCLRNFLMAFRRIGGAHFHLIHDGEPREEIFQMVKWVGSIETLPQVGNSATFWRALDLALNVPADALIYFVEDDYLHLPEALVKLAECRGALDVDYITLYDHPVRYMPNYPPGRDLPLRKDEIYISGTHHWRTVESSCMTFAATASVLREDAWIFDEHVRQKDIPQDRELFRHLQGLGPYEDSPKPRTLIGPIPSLATHLEEPWLAPNVDWARVADAVWR